MMKRAPRANQRCQYCGTRDLKNWRGTSPSMALYGYRVEDLSRSKQKTASSTFGCFARGAKTTGEYSMKRRRQSCRKLESRSIIRALVTPGKLGRETLRNFPNSREWVVNQRCQAR